MTLAEIARVRDGARPAKVAYPIGLSELEVRATRLLGAGLLRVTLGGADGFETHVPEEHVRIVLPDADGVLRLPERDGRSLRWPRPLPVSREYTVRRYDAATGELDLDVALHGGGIGSDWARAAAPGDRVHVAGPPGGVVLPAHHRRWLFAGDVTALPQIARYLEHLPADATGRAVLEASEAIPLDAPSGVRVEWVAALEPALRADPPPVDAFVWIAGEAGALRPLRRWVRDELHHDPAAVRISGYWKRGVVDFDDHADD